MNSNGDMEVIEWWHNPELAFDKTIPKTFKAISIGWLEHDDYPKGEIAEEDLKLLEELCRSCQIDQGWLGYHTCNLCSSFEDRGEVLLRAGNKNYVMPHMILHYVKDHQYKPPDQFIDDLRRFKT